jgi:hypothetical protein
MESLKNKKFYLHRRAEQLEQWDRVIDRMKARVANAQNQSKIEILHHIMRIQVKKASIVDNLMNLQKAGNEVWDDMKSDVEKKWVELRNAFLDTSARSQ